MDTPKKQQTETTSPTDEKKAAEAEVKFEEVVAEATPDMKASEPAVDANDEKIADLEAKLKEKVDENARLKSDMLIVRADADNYRKRMLRDKEDAVKFANSSLIKDLLGPLDDFSRAIEASTKTEDFKALSEGVVMIEDRMYSILKSWGMEEISECPTTFDPNEHEACLMVEDETCDKETVLQVLQKGYRLHGRVLRPAKVKVGKPKN